MASHFALSTTDSLTSALSLSLATARTCCTRAWSLQEVSEGGRRRRKELSRLSSWQQQTSVVPHITATQIVGRHSLLFHIAMFYLFGPCSSQQNSFLFAVWPFFCLSLFRFLGVMWDFQQAVVRRPLLLYNLRSRGRCCSRDTLILCPRFTEPVR